MPWITLCKSLVFGIFTMFQSKMGKVRKLARSNLNWRVNISKTTTVKTPKFLETLCLGVRNLLLRFRMVSKFYSEMNKVENHLKITWNKERVNTSQSTRVEACNLGYGLRLRPWEVRIWWIQRVVSPNQRC